VTIVVKIGGAALEDAATLRKCARAIAELAQDGHRVAVVHGGGSALTRVLKQLGKQSEFIGGLRMLWRGFDGGQQAREFIDAFFDQLATRSTEQRR